jgi:hypothetical protein
MFEEVEATRGVCVVTTPLSQSHIKKTAGLPLWLLEISLETPDVALLDTALPVILRCQRQRGSNRRGPMSEASHVRNSNVTAGYSTTSLSLDGIKRVYCYHQLTTSRGHGIRKPQQYAKQQYFEE